MDSRTRVNIIKDVTRVRGTCRGEMLTEKQWQGLSRIAEPKLPR